MLAIIPARGGSCEIPRKNLSALSGKPLIAYTILAAVKSQSINRIIVSTEDLKIAQVARDWGAEVPFMRPESLATENALAVDTYIYTLLKLNKDFGMNYSECVVLQPTSPLRSAEDIDRAAQIYKVNNADSVISVCKAPHPPRWSLRMNATGRLQRYFEDSHDKNRQTLEAAYMPNGAIFILKLSLLLSSRSYYFENTYPYLMPPERSIDIDTAYDLHLAELLIRELSLP